MAGSSNEQQDPYELLYCAAQAALEADGLWHDPEPLPKPEPKPIDEARFIGAMSLIGVSMGSFIFPENLRDQFGGHCQKIRFMMRYNRAFPNDTMRYKDVPIRAQLVTELAEITTAQL